MGMPGTIPFFEALWALIRLQALPEELGGAGGYRIEWELDDAVFKEAAGKDFMLEAIDVLKGVLGFEEMTCGRNSRESARSGPKHYQPASSGQTESEAQQTKRMRAPSDPFLDSPRSGASSGGSGLTRTSGRAAVALVDTLARPEDPIFTETETGFDESEEYLRIWTFPDLSNGELVELLKIFPAFVSRRSLPRFHVDSVLVQREIGRAHV